MPIERTQLIRLMVLDSICDNCENIDQIILPQISKDCLKLGFDVSRSEIVNALTALVNDGLAKACWLYPHSPDRVEIDGMPCVETPEEVFKTYFYITSRGMELHLADDSWWPFDESGNVKQPQPKSQNP